MTLGELAEWPVSLSAVAFSFTSPAMVVRGHRTIKLLSRLTADEGGGKSAAGKGAGGSSPGDGEGGALDEHGGRNWGGAERGCGGVKLQSWR